METTSISCAVAATTLIQDADGQESLYFRDARGYDDFSVTREANGDVRIAVGSSSAMILAARLRSRGVMLCFTARATVLWAG